jgi:hypothetical protein
MRKGTSAVIACSWRLRQLKQPALGVVALAPAETWVRLSTESAEMWERHRSNHDPMISALARPAGASVAVNNRVVCDCAIVAEVMAVRLPK